MTDKINKQILLGYIGQKNIPEDVLNHFTNNDVINKLGWEELYLTALILEKNNKDNKYDSLIIDYLEESHRKGLNIKANKEYYLESLKILAALYLKYSNYNKANNCLLLLEGNIFEKPEWLIKLKSAVHIYNYIDLYINNPRNFVNKILDYDGNRELKPYEISIIKTFIYKCLDIIDKDLTESPSRKASLYLNLINIIESNGETFKDEFELLMNKIHTCLDQAFEEVTANEPRILSIVIKDLYNETIRIKEIINNELNDIKGQLLKIDSNVEKKIIDTIRSQEPEIDDNKIISAENIRILILGDINIQENDIYGIAKAMYNIPKKNIEILKDWDKIKNFNIEKLRYCSSYDGIMLGPIPHSIRGKGEYSSFFELIKNEEGFPLHVEVREPDGRPKITKATFKEALRRLVEGILANKIK